VNVRFSPRALANIRAIGTYVAKDNPAAADRLLDRMHALASMLGGHPLAGHTSDVRNVRVITMARDPYRLFYEIAADAVHIIHIRHTSRRVVHRLK
jgi:toxin ParE1/3/4